MVPAAGATVVAALVCAGLLGGCGKDDDDAGAAAGNATDRAFAGSMIPHHESAVDMGRLAERGAGRAELKSLARQIVRSQRAEIRTLRRIDRQLAGEGVKRGRLGLDRNMMGMGMNMHGLASARPFDRAFIDMMVPHHLGAIRMSRVELRRGDSEELRALARDIIDAQTREIRRMRGWRKAWYGSGAAPAAHGGHTMDHE
jgi:uncharacterized protein (DUF305 family)